jgi:tetratricopeptide (TPR) repeat protein
VYYENKDLNIAPSVFFPLKQVIEFIANDANPITKVQASNGESLSYYPTKNFYVPVDRQKVLANGVVQPADAALVVDSVNFTVNRNNLMKNDLITLDIIATANWDRPIYFAITTGSEAYLNLEGYFQLEGLTYRLVPIRTEMSQDRELGHINTDVMYDNIMNKFVWGNMDKPGIYLDETILRQTKNFRNLFYRLAKKLIDEGKKDKAIAVLDRCLKVMPQENVPYDIFMIRIVEGYYQAGAKDKASKLNKELAKIYESRYNYFNQYRGGKLFKKVEQNVGESQQILGYCQQVSSMYGDTATAAEIRKLQGAAAAPGMQ